MSVDRSRFIQGNHQDFEDQWQAMAWVDPAGALEASRQREDLVAAIFNHPGAEPGWMFGRTKLFTHAISPGCRLCGQGKWSCLFINNICNARCFYCPDRQSETGVPITNSLEYSNPSDYAAYVSACGIQGVSFSGGEPLMTYDRVVEYLTVLRRSVEHPLYVWMYTNGILVTREKLLQLRDLGLDEIRFDISADGYALDKVRLAVGIIPTVTVEVPAIPEDVTTMKTVMEDLTRIGVSYLNLHQIRCTAHNLKNLMSRGYTFLHGPKVTVLDTELAALELMGHAAESGIRLPVNYCAYHYRYQFQGAGARKRASVLMKAGHEDVTDTGYIRSLSLAGSLERLEAIEGQLTASGISGALWSLDRKAAQLKFSSCLWPSLDRHGLSLQVSYFNTAMRPRVTYRYPFKEIRLNSRSTLVVEKRAEVRNLDVDPETEAAFDRKFASVRSIVTGPEEDGEAAWFPGPAGRWEGVSEGFSAYY